MNNVITEERRAKIDSLREAARNAAATRRVAGERTVQTLEEALGEPINEAVSVEVFIEKNGLEGDK